MEHGNRKKKPRFFGKGGSTMFRKDDYVFYESEGICRVSDILRAPLEGMPEDREYYMLRPIYSRNGVLYVPVDNDKIYMRAILKKEEAEELVNEIPKLEEICEEDSKKLRATYTELLQSHLPRNWVRILKTARTRLQNSMAKGQRLSDTERTVADSARRFLHSELALALDLDETEVEAYIRSRIGDPA